MTHIPSWRAVVGCAREFSFEELQRRREQSGTASEHADAALYDAALNVRAHREPLDVLIEHLIIWEENNEVRGT